MYNKVKRILRARNGSQVPKYNGGNLFPLIDLTGLNGDGQTQLNDISGNTQPEIKGVDIPLKDLTKDPNSLLYKPTFKDKFNNSMKKVGTGLSGAAKAAGNFMTNNASGIGMAMDGISNAFFKDTTDSETVGMINQGIDAVSNTLMAVNPVAGMIGKGVGLAFNAVNSLGGKKADSFSIDQSTAEQVGGSYGGSMNLMTDAASKSGKKYGLFSNKSRKKANRQIAEANRQQNVMSYIADEASDMQAMAGNNLNYLSYLTDLSGGYDQRYMRAAKQGMKIQDRITLAKSRNLSKHIINVDTKLIEGFKNGGVILNLAIDIDVSLDLDWEPTFVEEFKDGGKTEQKLETSEIEETTQKNVIPEGALHKNKHHIEHTEGLTQKGIPVVDNEGELQAEIEHSEIIFTLEVTKKLEELYEDYYDNDASLKDKDETAIEAGKLLVYLILFNTDDRTKLIKNVKE